MQPRELTSKILHQDNKLYHQGIQDNNHQRKSLLERTPIPKRMVAALAAMTLLTAAPTQAREIPTTQSTVERTQNGNPNSLKTSLLAQRIHEAFVAEHIQTGDFEKSPKKYMPIPGYINPNQPFNDTRIGTHGRLEQNILQPAADIAPALINKLTGTYATNILKTLGNTAKEQSELWPKNRDQLAQNIQTIWANSNRERPTPFQTLSQIEQEKYRRIADGLMYVTTIEKHRDRMDKILQKTNQEAALGKIPSAEILADRLHQIQKSAKLLRGTELAEIPNQTWEIVASQTPKERLADAISILNPNKQLGPRL